MGFFWRIHCVSIIIVLCFSLSFRARNEVYAFQSRSRRSRRSHGIQIVTTASSPSSSPIIRIAICATRDIYINHPKHLYSRDGRDDIDTIDIDIQTEIKTESEIQLQQPSSQSPRRRFLSSSTTATFAFAALLGGMSRPRQAEAATPAEDSARTQWKQAKTTLDELLRDWSTEQWAAEVGGGDNVSTKLGTKGGVSPLYQIEKAFLKLRDSEFVDDDVFVEFQDAADDFMVILYRADSLASSSNNKTGSGKQTPPAVFLEQSRAEVVELQKLATKLDAMVK
uniref:Uncharacterized protein n=1 Tax=Pseudo-nitzschia australis TaxID=44445 RepID=A0A7S4AD62_9STRA|mmetsp:Transcript_20572/g.44791  ORF Transcript_20572/g.44791 Transcript_20572/m.44791 type:complete len:281 (+) Transcript_20572:142-984(+)|eukprot:CAMPEP_0168191392 /NCGR_PEP_ID=MMETSP0139_2-20121125/17495_1 /TAXON_ID=44445 /ORGANISM="Pseudo-nitzschia australis, Strain 10249 10 AB" /LENGTH=280 /DNA_ID=CAMNT_0008114571 /DNA_START=65 /DNA_END=907 /DNA_ORIENTATION=+